MGKRKRRWVSDVGGVHVTAMELNYGSKWISVKCFKNFLSKSSIAQCIDDVPGLYSRIIEWLRMNYC